MDPRHQVGRGVLDLAGRRSMVDHGSFAVVRTGTQEWSGRSGRALRTLPSSSPRAASPLWLVDLVADVTAAADRGDEEVDGQRWRHLTATADLAQASSRRPEGMARPARNRYEEPRELPLEVWLDGSRLSRARFVDAHRTESVTLVEPGVETAGLDWSRLPDLG